MANPFCWYELMTSDPAAAAAFYRRVLGLEPADAGLPDRPYTVLSAGPAPVGGIMAIPEQARAAGARPGWSGYVLVDDVDAHAARVVAAGGRVHRAPEDIPGVGRFAVVADPHGAVFMLFKNAGGEGRPRAAPGTPGQVGWHELHAGDGASAFGFYSGLFGWTRAQAFDMGPMGAYQTFGAGGAPFGGMMTMMPGSPAPFWLYYFNVASLDPAQARVTEGGGKVLMGPHQVPTGQWILQCADPQGAMFALLAPSR